MAWFGAGILAIFASGSRPIIAVRMAEVGRRQSSAAASIRARPSRKERSSPLLCKADAGRVMLIDPAGNEERWGVLLEGSADEDVGVDDRPHPARGSTP